MATIERWLYDPTVGRLVAIIVGLLLVVVLVRALQRLATTHVHDGAARYRARKFISFMGYLAAALLILAVYSSKLAGLTVAFGVAGAGIAFALQEVIASVAGWVALTFSRWYAPGDRVELGGIRGDVIDIGVLRTTIMELGQWVDGDLYNGRIVRVANSYVFKAPVFNYSGEFPFLWDEIRVPVRYGSDRERARAILQQVVEEVTGDNSRKALEVWESLVAKYRIENASVEPLVTLIATDNWLDFTVRYVVDYRRRRITKNELFNRILAAFDQTNSAVQLASGTYEIVAVPPIELKQG